MKTTATLLCSLALLCGAYALPTIAPAPIDCGNGLSCAAGQTCFTNATGAGELFACSPFPNAVFCHDSRFSCPASTTCNGEAAPLSQCVSSDGTVVGNATWNVDAVAVSKFRNFGNGMVQVKNVVCRIPIPSFCTCSGSGALDGTITCSVGIPLSSLRIGASASLLPCGTPASFGYRAFIGRTTLTEKKWTADFGVNINLPAPPAGFNLGVMSLKTRAELRASLSTGIVQASVGFGVCGSVTFIGSCCNTDCPLMDEAPLPVRLFRGSYDFSDLC